MRRTTDADPYRRRIDTLLASWQEYARGAVDAAPHRRPGLAAVVFPRDVPDAEVTERISGQTIIHGRP